jgi:hypothetical protein
MGDSFAAQIEDLLNQYADDVVLVYMPTQMRTR